MPNTLHILPFRRNHKHGFTLVELMIVIAIIGLLAVALLPKLIGAQSNTRDVARKKDLQTIAAALEQVYDERGKYPVGEGNGYAPAQEEAGMRIPGIFEPNYGAFFWCISTSTGDSASFLLEKLDGGKVPLDPSMQRNGNCWDWDVYSSNRSILNGTYMYSGLIPEAPGYFFMRFTDPVSAKGYILHANMENYHNANAYVEKDSGYSFLGYFMNGAEQSWSGGNWIISYYYGHTTEEDKEEDKKVLQAFKDSLKPIEEKRPTYPYLDFPADYRFVIIKDHILEP